MQKSFVTALMLTATLGLAACDSEPENKLDAAKEAIEHKSEQLTEATKEATEAVKEKIHEIEEIREEHAE